MINAYTDTLKNKNTIIPIIMFDQEENFIKEYESANLASQATKVCYMSIKKCRCGRQKTAGGYKWVYNHKNENE